MIVSVEQPIGFREWRLSYLPLSGPSPPAHTHLAVLQWFADHPHRTLPTSVWLPLAQVSQVTPFVSLQKFVSLDFGLLHYPVSQKFVKSSRKLWTKFCLALLLLLACKQSFFQFSSSPNRNQFLDFKTYLNLFFPWCKGTLIKPVSLVTALAWHPVCWGFQQKLHYLPAPWVHFMLSLNFNLILRKIKLLIIFLI